MRKPVYDICAQQRHRSACAVWSAPFLFATWIVYCRYLLYLKSQKSTSLCSSAGWFESYLVANPKDRFSRDQAQIPLVSLLYFLKEHLMYTKEKCCHVKTCCSVLLRWSLLHSTVVCPRRCDVDISSDITMLIKMVICSLTNLSKCINLIVFHCFH